MPPSRSSRSSLLAFTLKDFRAQLRRLVLTGAAVAVGVAFLVLSVGGAGALVQSYEQSAAIDVGDAPVQVTPRGNVPGAPLPADAAAKAARVPGVAAVAPRVAGHANVLTPAGRPLDDRAMVTSIAARPDLRWQRLATGAWPEHPGEIALDEDSATRVGARTGDTVRITTAKGTTARVRVTGLLDTASSQTLGSHPALGIPEAAVATYATGSRTTHLDLALRPGADPHDVAKDVRHALGDGVAARTHAASVEEAKSSGRTMYAVVLTAALSFVLIAMAVARMVVTNTFSVVLAQRARQLALLRCVGADRDQIRRIIRRQGLLLGVLASAAGLAAGAGACALGTALLNGLADLGPVEISLMPGRWTFLLGGLFGVLLTLWAVRRPARAASAVPPVAALAASGAATLPEPGSRSVREVVSVLMLVAGGGLLAIGAFGGSAIALLAVTLGAILTFFAVLRYARHLLPPVVGLIGLALRRPFGTVGRLSVQQLRANGARTAAAASAMLVGVTVAISAVTAIGITKGGLEEMLTDRMPAVFALDPDDASVPAGALAALRAEPHLTVTPVRTTTLTVDGRRTVVATADPAGLNPRADGVAQARALRDGEALGPLRRAGAGLTVVRGGETLPMGIHPDASLYVTGATFARLAGASGGSAAGAAGSGSGATSGSARVSTVLVNPADGTSHDEARAALDRALGAYPGIGVADTGSDARLVRAMLDRLMLVVTVLLGFSTAIAALGVAATLMLTVEERTREFGMLRAIGLLGGQLRRMLTLESVLLALSGALAGTLLGLVYGTLAARSVLGGRISPLAVLGSSGGTALTILGLLAATVLTGVAASVLPARRVRRMVIVEALREA
ncbi:FtsX-like permease family protein [Streptomyces sp. NPDC048718]|uniref:FtsX-like permease family protein n=1 Tax=Streptomyces sp. NPDC048718 TaxID=3365587 RepID=UPI00371D6005